MKKLKVFLVLGVLMFGMSSCVYSLFPIYTEDTLVFLPELIGKWQTNPDAPEDYIEFKKVTEEDEGITVAGTDAAIQMNDDTDGDPETYNYFMSGPGWSIKSDSPITVEVDGEEISNPAEVKMYYDAMFGEMQTDVSTKTGEMINEKLAQAIDSINNGKSNLNEKLEKLGEGLNKLGKSLSKLDKALNKIDADFKGTGYVSTEDSYKMIVRENGEETPYLAHLVQIGEDYFLDVYPLPEYTSDMFGGNLFPVHTFFKLSVEKKELKLTMFDLEKLNELFESNLVRLRHEYVNGSVLITAQPKEIQKFLDKYSDDETVFESEEVYAKID